MSATVAVLHAAHLPPKGKTGCLRGQSRHGSLSAERGLGDAQKSGSLHEGVCVMQKRVIACLERTCSKVMTCRKRTIGVNRSCLKAGMQMTYT